MLLHRLVRQPYCMPYTRCILVIGKPQFLPHPGRVKRWLPGGKCVQVLVFDFFEQCHQSRLQRRGLGGKTRSLVIQRWNLVIEPMLVVFCHELLKQLVLDFRRDFIFPTRRCLGPFST